MTVVVGVAPAGEDAETARSARLAAEAAARAGVPLLLLQPAPLTASWEVLALYPHEDVLAQVTFSSRLVTLPVKNWRVMLGCVLVEGGRRPVPSQGLAERCAVARGQCTQRCAHRARRREAGAAGAPAAAETRGCIA